MAVAGGDDPGAYVTLIQAAQETGESLEGLRKAVRRREIRGVRENPENKRSRWLVALDDVRRFAGEGSIEDSDSSTCESDATEQVTPGGHNRPVSQPSVEMVHAEDHLVDDSTSMVRKNRDLRDVGVEPTQSAVESSSMTEPPGGEESARESILASRSDRGDELLLRLTAAIDRFSDNVPGALLDYQTLVDRYVVAAEGRAAAEAQTASLQRQIDNLLERVAAYADDVDRVRAQNRQLLAEFEVAQEERDAALDEPMMEEGRPLWRRRHRR